MIAEFIRAASEGDIAALQGHPELVNTRHDGATALHFAAINGQMEAAQWLLAHGADLEAEDNEFHSTPVGWAHEKGRNAMVEFLLERGAEMTPLDAAGFGKLERLKAFVAADRSVLTKEEDWGTVVHNACIWGRVEVLEWLIAQGADVKRRSRHGFTPLEIAERQARNGCSHTTIVTDERKAELERDCAKIAERMRTIA